MAERTPFRGEPETASARFTRAWLAIGRNRDISLACVWDRSATKLHLDLNANQDLGDDRPVSLTKTGKGWQAKGLRLLLGGDVGRREYVVDWRSNGEGPRSSLTVRSGWTGSITAQGRAWRVSVVDNLDGVLDSGDVLTVQTIESRLANSLRFPVPHTLCLDGADRAMSFRLETTSAGTEVVAVSPEPPRPAGRLEIEGTCLGYVMLESTHRGRRCVAALASPGAVVTLPVGTYAGRVWLKDCSKGMSLQARLNARVQVREAEVASLKAGGPLNSSVSVRREGSVLVLEYRLDGIGGEEYTKHAYAPPNAPSFTVMKGDRVCVSGVFEYG